jgi:hypothetical protein
MGDTPPQPTGGESTIWALWIPTVVLAHAVAGAILLRAFLVLRPRSSGHAPSASHDAAGGGASTRVGGELTDTAPVAGVLLGG